MRGKCNCGKRAISEYLIRDNKCAWTILFCADCKPKHDTKIIYRIDK